MGGWREGWTGVREFFDDKNLGICAYSLNNMKLTHGGAQITKEDARYDINQLPNTLSVEQGDNSQFFYSINWFNGSFAADLECANSAYSPQTTEKLIELAKVIDKSI